jgi:hypothetical protein
MKARVPKAYRDLSPRQKEQLKDYIVEIATEAAKKQEEHDCRVILDLYMKMVCCVLHDAFGFGEKRLTMFIGNHRRLFARQSRLVDKGQQLYYLDRRMSEIFKKDGFPQEFVDSILGEVELVDKTDSEG